MHLPEAGPGQHPANRDGRLDRRARPAVGRGDLRPADPLEPTLPRAPVRPPLQRQEGAGRGPRAGRIHARTLPLERRLRRRRHRRPEDRTAALVLDRRGRRGHRADPRLDGDGAAARPAPARRLRRRFGVRHHGALGQELLDSRAPDAGAAQPLLDPRRRALRGHSGCRAGVRFGLRPRGHRGRSGASDDRRNEEQHHPGRPQGLRLSE